MLVGELGLEPCDFGFDVFEVAWQVVLRALIVEVAVFVSFLLGQGLVVEGVKGSHGENPAVDAGENPALVGETPAGEKSVGESLAVSAGENPALVGETPVGENPVGENSVGENPVGESSALLGVGDSLLSTRLINTPLG